ncbi:MAG: hypothetical protein DHS80DRAFT_31844 [Piptocephalis tieghemiana]|nr:MAG: hypothetical protein DHS80DRAFT_31844 [Piptocephalis tieghemiana]
MSFTGKDTSEDHHLLPQLIPALTSSKPPGGLRVESSQVGRELTKLRSCDADGCLYCREWAFLLGRRLLRPHASSSTPVSLSVLGREGSSTSGKAPPTGSLKPRGHISSLMKDLEKQEGIDAFLTTLSTWMSQCPLAVVQASTVFLPITLDERTLDSSPAHEAAVLAQAQYASTQPGSDTGTISSKQQKASSSSSSPFSPNSTLSSKSLDIPSTSSSSSPSSSTPVPTLIPEESPEESLHTSALCLLSQALTVDKRGVGLTEDDMPLLGALNSKSLLLDLTFPTCHHRRGKDWGPTDLAHEGRILNETLFAHGKADAEACGKAAQPVWEPVRALIRSFQTIAQEFIALREGSGMPSASGSADGGGVRRAPGWNDVFGPVVEAAKKKGKSGGKGGTDTSHLIKELDDAATTYLQGQASAASSYHEEVLKPRLDALDGLWEQMVKATQEACDALDVPLAETHINDHLLAYRKTSAQTKALLAEHLKEAQRLYEEDAQSLREVYFNETKATLTGRMERAASKDFRKMTRRLESNQAQARSRAITLILEQLDETVITQALLRILPPILSSMESREEKIFFALGMENRSTLRSLVQKRQRLEAQYRAGIRRGQRTVGLAVGRLLLREGRRILELQKAERKGEALLETIGSGESADGKKQKKKKKKQLQQQAKAKLAAEEEETMIKRKKEEEEEKERQRLRRKAEEEARKEVEMERRRAEMEEEKKKKQAAEEESRREKEERIRLKKEEEEEERKKSKKLEEERRRRKQAEEAVAAQKAKETLEAAERLKQVPTPVSSPTVIAWPKTSLTPKKEVNSLENKEEGEDKGKMEVESREKEQPIKEQGSLEKERVEEPVSVQHVPTPSKPLPSAPLSVLEKDGDEKSMLARLDADRQGLLQELTRSHQHVLALQERCQQLADTCRSLEGGLRERDAMLAAAVDREAAAVRDACAAGTYVGTLERRLREAERLLHLHSMSTGPQSPNQVPGGSGGPWSPSGTPNGTYHGGFEFSSPPPPVSFSQVSGPGHPSIEGTMTPPTHYPVPSGGNAVEEAAKRLETELFDEPSMTHRDGSSFKPPSLSLRSRAPSISSHGPSPAMSPRSPRSPSTMIPPPGMMGPGATKPLGRSMSNGLLRHLPMSSPSTSSPSSPTTSTGASSSFLASAGAIGPGTGLKATPPGLPASPTLTNGSALPFRRTSSTFSSQSPASTSGNWRAGPVNGHEPGSWRSRASSPELTTPPPPTTTTLPKGPARGNMRSTLKCANCGTSGHRSDECTEPCRKCDSLAHTCEMCPSEL